MLKLLSVLYKAHKDESYSMPFRLAEVQDATRILLEPQSLNILDSDNGRAICGPLKNRDGNHGIS